MKISKAICNKVFLPDYLTCTISVYNIISIYLGYCKQAPPTTAAVTYVNSLTTNIGSIVNPLVAYKKCE